MPLPAQISASTGENNTEWVHEDKGPWKIGGNLYAVLFNITNQRWGVYKSTDGGLTWAEKDAANGIAWSQHRVEAFQSSTYIVVLAASSFTNIRIKRFDTTTDTYAAAVDATIAVSDPNFFADLDTNNGIIMIQHKMASATIMGNPYTRTGYRTYTISTNTLSSATNLNNDGTQNNYELAPTVYAPAVDTVMFYYRLSTTWHMKNIVALGSLSSQMNNVTTGGVSPHQYSRPIAFTNNGVNYIGMLRPESVGLKLDYFVQTTGVPSWSVTTLVISGGTGDPGDFTAKKELHVDPDGHLHAIWTSTDLTSGRADVWWSENPSTANLSSWTTPTKIKDVSWPTADDPGYVRASILDSSKIGFVYGNSATITGGAYYDEYTYAAVGNMTPVTLAAGLTLTPTSAQRRGKPISVGLTETVAVVKKAYKAPAVTETLTPAVVKKKYVPEDVTATLTAAVTVRKSFPRSLAAGITLTAAMVKAPARLLAVGLTLTPTQARVSKSFRTVAAGLILTPAVVKKNFRVLAFTMPLTALMTVNKRLLRPVVAGLTLTPNMARVKSQTLAASLSLATAMTPRSKYFRTVTAGLTLTPVIQRKHFKLVALGATLTPLVAVRTQNRRTLDATLNETAAMSRVAKLFRPVAVTLTITPDMVVDPVSGIDFVTLAATLTETPAMTRFPKVAKAVTLTQTPAIVKRSNRTFPLTLTISPVMVRTAKFFRPLAAVLSLSPVMGRIPLRARVLSASMALSVAQTRLPKLPRSVNLTLTPDLDAKALVKMDTSLVMSPENRLRFFKGQNVILTMQPSMEATTGYSEIQLQAVLILNPTMQLHRPGFPGYIIDAGNAAGKLLAAGYKAVRLLAAATKSRLESAE